MSRNGLFIYDDLMRVATVTASSEAGVLVATNVQDDQPKKVWRTTGKISETLTIDLLSETGVDSFAFINHNGTIEATVNVEISANSDLSSPVLNQTYDLWEPVQGWSDTGWGEDGWGGYPILSSFYDYKPIRTLRLGASYTGRYIRFTFADPTNTATYLQFGKIMAGIGRQTTYNFERGWRNKWEDQSIQTGMDDGSVWVDGGANYRRLTLPFGDLLEAEATGWIDDLLRICGKRRPFLLAPHPDDFKLRYRTTMLALFTDMPEIDHAEQNARRITIEVRELF